MTEQEKAPEKIHITMKNGDEEKPHITTFIAVGISIIALAISGYTAYLAMEHNHQSVKPLFSLWRNDTKDEKGSIWQLYNAGLGPGEIKEAALFVEGERIHHDLNELATWKVIESASGGKVSVKWEELVVDHEIVKDGDDLELFTVTWDSKEIAEEKDMDEVAIIAYCYCSVYDECQYADSRAKSSIKPPPLLPNCK